jgi:hypothetical protein
VTVRENTERPVTVASGTNVVAGTKKENIKNAILKQIGISGGGLPKNWDGKAAQRIVEILSNSGDQNFLSAFIGHTKCPASSVRPLKCTPGQGPAGFFTLSGIRLYGRTNAGVCSRSPEGDLPRVDSSIVRQDGVTYLPFSPDELIDNLRREKYAASVNTQISYVSNNQSLPRRLYYAIRPLLPVGVRKHLQRIALQDWSKISFPSWPIDATVENFVDWLWIAILNASGEKEIPFIWYWPRSHQSCAIMTHDVETGAGQDFCPTVLKLEAEFGIKSAFELVPEVRYVISSEVMEAIKKAGSEVCVHGLNHDGRLFSSEELFRTRVKAINQYAQKWEAKGFRSSLMYRNFDWYDGFKISYDMSVPNVAHLDPQRGGCCTLFPYFVGDVLELPLTTIQDYPLFNIIRTDPMQMWSGQIDSITEKHGLVSFIIHPDYIVEPEKQEIYRRLLHLLVKHSTERGMWLALPGEVDTWWRERAKMTLEMREGSWVIRGEGSERASIAFARLENGKLKYVLTSRDQAKVEYARGS